MHTVQILCKMYKKEEAWELLEPYQIQFIHTMKKNALFVNDRSQEQAS